MAVRWKDDPIQYDKEHRVRMSLSLGKDTDADIIEKLESVSKKQTYIKDLIRADIAREKEEKKNGKED